MSIYDTGPGVLYGAPPRRSMREILERNRRLEDQDAIPQEEKKKAEESRRIPVLTAPVRERGDEPPKPAMISTVTVGELERLRDIEAKAKELSAKLEKLEREKEKLDTSPERQSRPRRIDWRD